jgi:hypothetical protein
MPKSYIAIQETSVEIICALIIDLNKPIGESVMLPNFFKSNIRGFVSCKFFVLVTFICKENKG